MTRTADMAVTDNLSLEVIFKRDLGGSTVQSLVDNGYFANSGGWALMLYDGYVRFWYNVNNSTTFADLGYPRINDTNWHYFALTYDHAGSGTRQAYRDTEVQSAATTGTLDMTGVVSHFWVGYQYYNAADMDGIIDEVRLSKVPRGAAWIKATYNTAWDYLLSFGATEGSKGYSYDANGNMTARPYQSDNQTLTWDAENRPVTISQASGNATFVYDGNGNRVKKTGGGVTTIYVNRYYEKNLTSGNVTSSYYLGDRLIAQREGTVLRYIHQDHLTGTAVMSSDNGTLISSIKFYPFGSTRSGSVPTDRQFTGQRLDGTGLYYYGARYYDAGVGRFISADIIVPNPMNPQSFNRYSYVLNNPLRYIDPTGHVPMVAPPQYLPLPPPPPPPPPPLPPTGGDEGGNGGGNSGIGPSLPVAPANPVATTPPTPAAPPTMPGTSPSSGANTNAGNQGTSSGTTSTTPQASSTGGLAVFPLIYLTAEACVPAFVGTATAAALTIGYGPAVGAGPVGWVVAVPVIAVAQVTVLVGGWGTSILLFQREIIPMWKEYLGGH